MVDPWRMTWGAKFNHNFFEGTTIRHKRTTLLFVFFFDRLRRVYSLALVSGRIDICLTELTLSVDPCYVVCSLCVGSFRGILKLCCCQSRGFDNFMSRVLILLVHRDPLFYPLICLHTSTRVWSWKLFFAWWFPLASSTSRLGRDVGAKDVKEFYTNVTFFILMLHHGELAFALDSAWLWKSVRIKGRFSHTVSLFHIKTKIMLDLGGWTPSRTLQVSDALDHMNESAILTLQFQNQW